MKKFLAIIITIMMILCCISACALNNAHPKDNGKIKVVCTVFPTYDFAKQVFGDNADVTLLLPPGSESHSYSPTVSDLQKILSCDLFIYCSGKSELWVNDVLNKIEGSDTKTIDITDGIEIIFNNDTHNEHDGHDAHEHTEEIDEHVWVSPKNAVVIIDSIASTATKIDAENSELYLNNTESYKQQIYKLDSQLQQISDGAKNKTLIFADRFPFKYLARDYDFDYYAVLSGCSSDAEPSLKQIKELVDKIKACSVSAIFYTELSDQSIADTVTAATAVDKVLLHSCHNVTKSELEKPTTYIELMNNNIKALREVLL